MEGVAIVPPAFHRPVAHHRRADVVVSNGEIFQCNSGVEIDPFVVRHGGGILRREVPAEQGVAAGSEAAEGGPAAGDGGERDVPVNVDVLGAAVADDPLEREARGDAADGTGVGDGESGAGAEGVGGRDDGGEDDDDDGDDDGGDG